MDFARFLSLFCLLASPIRLWTPQVYEPLVRGAGTISPRFSGSLCGLRQEPHEEAVSLTLGLGLVAWESMRAFVHI